MTSKTQDIKDRFTGPDGNPLPEEMDGLKLTYELKMVRPHKGEGCTKCAPGGPGHGPYLFAFFRKDGKVKSRYIGKPGGS